MSFHLSSSPIFHISKVQSEGHLAESSWWKMVRTAFLSGSVICSKTYCTLPSVWNSIPIPLSVIFYIPRHFFSWGKKKNCQNRGVWRVKEPVGRYVWLCTALLHGICRKITDTICNFTYSMSFSGITSNFPFLCHHKLHFKWRRVLLH